MKPFKLYLRLGKLLQRIATVWCDLLDGLGETAICRLTTIIVPMEPIMGGPAPGRRTLAKGHLMGRSK